MKRLDAAIDCVLNARADAFVRARGDRRAVDGLDPQKPTVISVPDISLPTSELQELGVARVSTGPFTQRVALTALQDAATEVFGGGTLPSTTRALN